MAQAQQAEKKYRERLKKWTTQKNAPKRWKAMTKIIDKETPENVSGMFTKNPEDVMLTFTLMFSALESAKESEKQKKQHELDALEFHKILRASFSPLQSMMKTKWKYKEISGFITKSMARQNKHCLRKAAIESLLLYTEILVDQPAGNATEINELLSVFAGAVLLGSFGSEIQNQSGVVIRLKTIPPSVDDNVAPLPAGPVEPASADAADVFTMLLDHLSSRVGKGNLFEFWFDSLHRYYFILLYPEIFKHIGSLGQHEDVGFTQTCPALLQQALIDKLDAWKDNATICEAFWSDMFCLFTMEIFRQSCQLPITMHATIKKSLELYKFHLVTKRRANLIKDTHIQGFLQSFVHSLQSVFVIDSNSQQSELHATLFGEIFATCDYMTLQCQMDDETWKTMQYMLLEGSVNFLRKNSASMLSDGKQDIARMADPLLDYLFKVWIRSPISTTELWRDLHDQFVHLTDWPHVVRQWKSKVLRLTEILVKFLYTQHGFVFEIPSDTPQEDIIQVFLGITHWTKDLISSTWYTVLHVLGNINEIKSAQNFEVAIKCVQEVVAILLAAEASLPLREEPRRMPPLEVFFPWLLEACYATGEKIRGVILAYSVLCQLFCAQSTKEVAPELLSHFYRAIQVGLRNENPLVRDQILTEAKHLFAYALSGSAVLIPDLITEINNVFKVRQGASPEVQKHAITLLNSLLCFPNHFRNVAISDVTRSREIAGPELREAISNMLISIVVNPNVHPIAKCMSVCGASVLLHEEVLDTAPRHNVIASALQGIFSQIRVQSEQVALTTCDVLISSSSLFMPFNDIDRNLNYSVISMICDNATGLLNEGLQTGVFRETVIASLLECAACWVTAGPNDFLRESTISGKMFSAIELALFGCAVDPTKPSSSTNISRVRVDEDMVSAPFFYLVEQLDTKPSHNSTVIKSHAEMLLYQVLNLYNNFPTPAGPAQLDARLSEDPERPVIFLGHNSDRIISLQEFTEKDQRQVRIITRDACGKQCWLARLDYKNDPRMPPANNIFPEPTPLNNKAAVTEVKPRQAELVATLLAQFESKHPDILPQTPKFVKFNAPVKAHDSYASEIEAIKADLNRMSALDQECISSYKEPRPSVDSNVHEPSEVLTSIQGVRLLLSQWGFLSPFARRTVHMLEDTPEFRAALLKLDSVPYREQSKAAVVFIREGQETFEEAVSNRAGSALYQSIVDGLGWKVDPAGHIGFRGDITDEYAPVLTYYSNARFEAAFQVMTTVSAEQHVLQRFLDSDPVHIVWCEHKRDYVPAPAIADSTTEAHLVVYPLPTGMFRIQVHKNDSYTFGPLLNGMITNKAILPQLLRTTAMMANRHIRRVRMPSSSIPPFVMRSQVLRDAITNYKKQRPAEVFHSNLFLSKSDDVHSQSRRDSFISQGAKTPLPSSGRAGAQPSHHSGGSSSTPQLPRTSSVSVIRSPINQSQPHTTLPTYSAEASPSGTPSGTPRSDLDRSSSTNTPSGSFNEHDVSTHANVLQQGNGGKESPLSSSPSNPAISASPTRGSFGAPELPTLPSQPIGISSQPLLPSQPSSAGGSPSGSPKSSGFVGRPSNPSMFTPTSPINIGSAPVGTNPGVTAGAPKKFGVGGPANSLRTMSSAPLPTGGPPQPSSEPGSPALPKGSSSKISFGGPVNSAAAPGVPKGPVPSVAPGQPKFGSTGPKMPGGPPPGAAGGGLVRAGSGSIAPRPVPNDGAAGAGPMMPNRSGTPPSGVTSPAFLNRAPSSGVSPKMPSGAPPKAGFHGPPKIGNPSPSGAASKFPPPPGQQ